MISPDSLFRTSAHDYIEWLQIDPRDTAGLNKIVQDALKRILAAQWTSVKDRLPGNTPENEEISFLARFDVGDRDEWFDVVQWNSRGWVSANSKYITHYQPITAP